MYNPYDVLHLPEDATYEEIKDRYRHLTINLHPDKQPLANYTLAHKHFKEIDEAYKSISSQLRRFVFREFGIIGVNVLSDYPYYFKEFEDRDIVNSYHDQEKIKEIMLYLMYEEHAAAETEQKSLSTVSMFLLWWPLNDEMKSPNLERCEYEYQMPMPTVNQFTSVLKVSHSSSNLSGKTKSGLEIGLSMSKRLQNQLILLINAGSSSQATQVGIGFNFIKSHNLTLNANIINIRQNEVHNPEFGFNYHHNDIYMSGRTSFQDTTFQIGSTDNQISKRCIKFGFEDGHMKVSPFYERQINRYLRLFVNLNIAFDREGFSPSLFYGYRLKLAKQLVIELGSYIDLSQNSRMQITLHTPKFKVVFPLLSHTNYFFFQLFKMGVFIGTYSLSLLYNYWKSRNKKIKDKIFFQNHNRIIQDKNTVGKAQAQCLIASGFSREKQIQFQGLVILAGFLLSRHKSITLEQKLNQIIKEHKDHNHGGLTPEHYKFFEEKRLTLIDQAQTEGKEQIYDITNILQATVIGAQCNGFQASSLKVNPCIDEFESPIVLVVYWMRGVIQIEEYDHRQKIRIGVADYSGREGALRGLLKKGLSFAYGY